MLKMMRYFNKDTEQIFALKKYIYSHAIISIRTNFLCTRYEELDKEGIRDINTQPGFSTIVKSNTEVDRRKDKGPNLFVWERALKRLHIRIPCSTCLRFHVFSIVPCCTEALEDLELSTTDYCITGHACR